MCFLSRAIRRKERAAGTNSNSARGWFRGGEHVCVRIEREGEEGLIKAEFFEQRRRITTRRTRELSGETARRKAQCFTVSTGSVSGRRESCTYFGEVNHGVYVTAILLVKIFDADTNYF